MTKFFQHEKNFSSLSVKDLLEAREAYHVHLSMLPNVVATAIGKYRIRKEDKNLNDSKSHTDRKQLMHRTLDNSTTMPWSWPSILVFVSKWAKEEEIETPDGVIPRFLYMPNGRVIPTCVIEAPSVNNVSPALQNLVFSDHLYGGGYPVLSEVQHKEHIGTIGCLVTDGDTVYGLTNRHVVGENDNNREPRKIFTAIHGERITIGTTHHRQVGKKPFEDTYKGFSDQYSYSNIDAGLIKLEDVNEWTSQVYGIGEIGEPVDLNVNTISLDLIDLPVRAHGGASGEMIGEIQALFYRYKSIGGFDYVSDLLIGPRNEKTPVMTRHGDSGTVWFFDSNLQGLDNKRNKNKKEKDKDRCIQKSNALGLQPIALQWGGHRILEDGKEKEMSFALATCLSTVCRELDVDIFRGWNIGYNEYWGETGHYKVATTACQLVSNSNLKKLIQANLENISFNDNDISNHDIKRTAAPLSDVPDLVWKKTRRGIENPNHFADMDQPGNGEFNDKTLLDICENPVNVDINIWNKFYDTLDGNPSRGTLPFRVWQIYKEMVDFLKQGKVAEFVCAAGILSHYVGDACQPLHISQYHDGNSPESKGVHAKYETNMLDRHSTEIVAGVNEYVKNMQAQPDVIGGKAASISTIELMRNTFKKLPPLKIIDVFTTSDNQIDGMFDALGDLTCACMGDGALRLAALWESAWVEGNGMNISDDKLNTIPVEVLADLYNDNAFLESLKIQDSKFAAILNV